MGILEFLECFDPLTEICVEDATEVVFEGRAEDFPEEKDKAYTIVPSRTNNRDGVVRLFVSKQEYLEKKCGENRMYALDAFLAILHSVMGKKSEAKQAFLTMVEKAEDYNEILQKWEKAPEKEKEPLEREKQERWKAFLEEKDHLLREMKQIEPLWDISGRWIGYSQEDLEYFAGYLVRQKKLLLERKHTLEAQSWAQCHEDELCQIMKAEYPNERIAALALEKQYGLDEQQARMIFNLRFRFMFGTARDLVERDNMVIGRMLEIFLKDEEGAEG